MRKKPSIFPPFHEALLDSEYPNFKRREGSAYISLFNSRTMG